MTQQVAYGTDHWENNCIYYNNARHCSWTFLKILNQQHILISMINVLYLKLNYNRPVHLNLDLESLHLI